MLFLFLSATNLQASWLNDGAQAYETVNKVRHWQAWCAFGLMTALLMAMKHISLITRPRVALAASVAIYAAVGMSGGFFFAEYAPIFWKLAKGIWYLFTALFDLIGSLA